jgi:hypothetical protein
VNLTHQIIATPDDQGVNCSVSDYALISTGCKYELPNGVMLDTEGFILNVTSANQGNGSMNSIAYPEFIIGMPIDFFVTYISPNTGHIVAMEYALCFCGQTYNSSVTEGQTLTTIISTWNTTTSLYDGEFYGWAVMEGGPVAFNISLDIIQNMMDASQEIFEGIIPADLSSGGLPGSVISKSDTEISISAQAIRAVLTQTGNESAAMDVFMNNLAISLTNRFVTPIKSIPSLAPHN